MRSPHEDQFLIFGGEFFCADSWKTPSCLERRSVFEMIVQMNEDIAILVLKGNLVKGKHRMPVAKLGES
jgi:hypothetical protein